MPLPDVIIDSIGNKAQFAKYDIISLSHSGTLSAYVKMFAITWKGQMQNDFADIRFVTSSGAHIPYWIESKTDGVSAYVWIKNDYLNGDTTVLMYYGNSVLSSNSSMSDVFITSADFEETGTPSGWANDTGTGDYDSTTHVWRGSEALTASVDGRVDHPSYDTSGITYVEMMIYFTSTPGNWYAIYQGTLFRLGVFNDDTVILVTSSGNYFSSGTLSNNTWYKLSLKHDNDNNLLSGYVYNTDGTLKESIVDKAHTVTPTLFQLEVEAIGWIDDFRVRKGTTTEPTYAISEGHYNRIIPQFM